MAKKRKVFTNPITIQLDEQRDIILENDKLYANDVGELRDAKSAGIVNGNAKGIHEWQQAAALRRAKVPLKLAKAMLSA